MNTENSANSETVIKMPTAAKVMDEAVSSNKDSSSSRILWIAAYVLLLVLVILRLPLINKFLSAQVPEDLQSELGDDRLLSLSMTVGTVLFFLLYAVILALYFSLAAFLDRRLIPGKAIVAGRFRVGAFFVIAILATIPVNLLSVTSGIVQPRELPGYWLYFPTTPILVLALYYRHWGRLSTSRKVLIVVSALGLSTVIAVG